VGGGDDATVKNNGRQWKITTTRYYTLIERQNELYFSVFAAQIKYFTIAVYFTQYIRHVRTTH
jgi:hypothetical protein